MSEMVERVAQELRNAAGMAVDGPYNLSKADSEYLARAAIEAMREPTEAMIEEGSGERDEWPGCKIVWSCMLDAALSTPDVK